MESKTNKTGQVPPLKKLAINTYKCKNNSQPPATKTQIKDMKTNKQKAPSSARLSGEGVSMARKKNQKPNAVRKSNMPLPLSASRSTSLNKMLLNKNTALKKRVLQHRNKSPDNESIKTDLPNKRKETAEISVQTNEYEILNHLLIVGNYKILPPSKSVTDEIDKLHYKKEGEELINSIRMVAEQAQREQQHSNNFTEILDKHFIKRKMPQLKDNFVKEDCKVIEVTDDVLQSEKPKIVSITDIRSRIRRKEFELLRLFDRLQNTNISN